MVLLDEVRRDTLLLVAGLGRWCRGIGRNANEPWSALEKLWLRYR